MIQPTRISLLNDRPVRSDRPYVLYWLQQSQRTRFNHALEFAVRQSNELGKPLIVAFGLMDDYPEATERHYAFMLQGLRDVGRRLRERGIGFVMRHGIPRDVAIELSRDAACVVCDMAYLRHLRRWRDEVADAIDVRLTQVESDVVVPVEVASNKAEVGARTLRPRIHRAWNDYLVGLEESSPKVSSTKITPTSDFDFEDVEETLAKIRTDRSVRPSTLFVGGEVEASMRLGRFVESTLAGYQEGRNEPYMAQSSGLAAYLQYGQVSPLEIALAVKASRSGSIEDRDTMIEELIVRRELSHNYCRFNPKYDSFDGLPKWAIASLEERSTDVRPIVYSRDQLEFAQTHDRYWNAAQMEMVLTGFMHNYMRMYWGKKVLEWSKTPRQAYADLLYLNNRYFLCGLNANSYGNVAWVFGQHDRPWGPARPIFGTIRYMNAAGLERKFDIDKYVVKIDSLSRQLRGEGIRMG